MSDLCTECTFKKYSFILPAHTYTDRITHVDFYLYIDEAVYCHRINKKEEKKKDKHFLLVKFMTTQKNVLRLFN